MPRKPRHLLWSEEACFHIFNRGHNRETVFRDDDDRCRFLNLCKRYRDRFGLRIYYYCLMDNHFHPLVQAGQWEREMHKWGRISFKVM